MVEASSHRDSSITAAVFVVIRLSPRRWAVAERSGITLPNDEFRIITKSFDNRIDAHQACSELAGKRREDYSELTREHLLNPRQLRGNSTPAFAPVGQLE
jgi:hypothetical protein